MGWYGWAQVARWWRVWEVCRGVAVAGTVSGHGRQMLGMSRRRVVVVGVYCVRRCPVRCRIFARPSLSCPIPSHPSHAIRPMHDDIRELSATHLEAMFARFAKSSYQYQYVTSYPWLCSKNRREKRKRLHSVARCVVASGPGHKPSSRSRLTLCPTSQAFCSKCQEIWRSQDWPMIDKTGQGRGGAAFGLQESF